MPILFDFNGTLFQDTDIHHEAWVRFLDRRGLTLTDDDFHRYVCGPPNDSILRHFLGPELTIDEIDRMSEEKESLYRSVVATDPERRRLTDGAPALFDRLIARGVPFGIVTGSIRSNVEFYFDTLGIGRWFSWDNVFYAEHDIPGKPDPAIYRLAMEKLGFAPAETVVVEDALAGIQSAVGAGIERVVAIDTTMGPDAFGAIPQVVAVIHDFTDFEAALPPSILR